MDVAVRIGIVRYKGVFQEDPVTVPWPVVDYLAEQLATIASSAPDKGLRRSGRRHCLRAPDTMRWFGAFSRLESAQPAAATLA
ncbi:DUF4158 domain-containing protein [Nonomuraea sp. NPDC049709]|uniref:DUF4158 domain-containing protein n=1 Tax=Nonomuraea sp. NPDC049709 TaxID=3154736 RepID=UPI003439D2D9